MIDVVGGGFVVGYLVGGGVKLLLQSLTGGLRLVPPLDANGTLLRSQLHGGVLGALVGLACVLGRLIGSTSVRDWRGFGFVAGAPSVLAAGAVFSLVSAALALAGWVIFHRKPAREVEFSTNFGFKMAAAISLMWLGAAIAFSFVDEGAPGVPGAVRAVANLQPDARTVVLTARASSGASRAGIFVAWADGTTSDAALGCLPSSARLRVWRVVHVYLRQVPKSLRVTLRANNCDGTEVRAATAEMVHVTR